MTLQIIGIAYGCRFVEINQMLLGIVRLGRYKQVH